MIHRLSAGLVSLAALVLFAVPAAGQGNMDVGATQGGVTGAKTGGPISNLGIETAGKAGTDAPEHGALAAKISGTLISLGVEAGINVSDLSIKQAGEELETDSETGYRAGLNLGWYFSEVFGLQTGAAYSQNGASTVPTAGVERSVDLAYLEVPLLLNARIPTGRSPVTPRFYAGGSADFELSCDVVETEGGEEFSEACDEGGLAGGTKSTNLNVRFGAGVDIQTGPGVITLDARYDHGLTDIADDPGVTMEVKNRSFQATVGFAFPLSARGFAGYASRSFGPPAR